MPQRVFITGAASGIGAEAARQLAAAGYHVVISARDPEKALAAAADIDGVDALTVGVDVSDQASVDAVADALAAYGGLDVLINNAANALAATQAAELADTPVIVNAVCPELVSH